MFSTSLTINRGGAKQDNPEELKNALVGYHIQFKSEILVHTFTSALDWSGWLLLTLWLGNSRHGRSGYCLPSLLGFSRRYCSAGEFFWSVSEKTSTGQVLRSLGTSERLSERYHLAWARTKYAEFDRSKFNCFRNC